MSEMLKQAMNPISNIKEFLQSVASNQSELTKDRTKVELDEVIQHYPNGVTITAFEIAKSNEFDTEFTICNIKENDKIYFFGGKILTNIFNALIQATGSLENANQALNLQPCVFKFTKVQSKDGTKNYYTVEIV